MKIRLIIKNHGWQYRLHVSEGPKPEHYYVALRAADGARLEHQVVTGPFRSLDVIRAQAVPLYLQLEHMLASVSATAPAPAAR